MEIIKLNTVGYYFYCPDLQIENYDKHINKKKLLSDCAICKRFILDPSYDSITNNRNIGKCGHIYHTDCINSWLKTNNVCPIDKINWHTFRIADSSTKLVLKEDKYEKKIPNGYNRNNCFSEKIYNFDPSKFEKMNKDIKNMKKTPDNYGDVPKNNIDVEEFLQNNKFKLVSNQIPVAWSTNDVPVENKLESNQIPVALSMNDVPVENKLDNVD